MIKAYCIYTPNANMYVIYMFSNKANKAKLMSHLILFFCLLEWSKIIQMKRK